MSQNCKNILRHVLASFLLIMFVSSATEAQIICDSFHILAKLKGHSLNVSLETDLPDSTAIIVSISRPYYEVDSSVTFSSDYFSEKSSVGKWKSKQILLFDNEKWLATLRSHQEKMSRLGLNYEIASVSDKIKIRMAVLENQPDPMFGRENSKLMGSRVELERSKVFVEDIAILNYPIDPALAMKRVPSLNPDALDVCQSYVVSKETPLMPETNPMYPLAALKKMKIIPTKGAFTVCEVRQEGRVPWYRVVAIDQNKQKIGYGWINSTALFGQKLTIYEGK